MGGLYEPVGDWPGLLSAADTKFEMVVLAVVFIYNCIGDGFAANNQEARRMGLALGHQFERIRKILGSIEDETIWERDVRVELEDKALEKTEHVENLLLIGSIASGIIWLICIGAILKSVLS
jgi:hypothetical protein